MALRCPKCGRSIHPTAAEVEHLLASGESLAEGSPDGIRAFAEKLYDMADRVEEGK